ncbi:MAG: glucose 1-dehydrogenase [Cyclobacteriaceae bacterium]|nr:glucose 1-dehydrogenase [Cyclobacteriaceae bacterium]
MKNSKTAIVTGAGRGIGKAIAECFAANHYHVIIAEKDESLGLDTQNLIREKGGNATFIKTDVSFVKDIERMILQTFQETGRIDVLINNAGISRFTPVGTITEDNWDHILNTNLRSAFFCAKEAASCMKASGGAIINIASTRAMMSEPNSEAYAASKGGLIALTHALAASLSPFKIKVNCISPGWIETGDYEKLKFEDHAQHFAGRVGKPQDIAEACLFLASEKSDFISGANLIIDGGMTKKMIYEP